MSPDDIDAQEIKTYMNYLKDQVQMVKFRTQNN